MLKNRDIIIVGLQPWDLQIGSNRKSIAAEFALHNRVLFVNAPLNRLTAIRRKDDPMVNRRLRILHGEEDELLQVGDNIWNFYPRTILEPITQLRFNWAFDILNYQNNVRFAKEIRKAIDQLNFQDYILFNDSDIFRSYHLKRLLRPEMYVYYSRDNLLAIDRWKRQGSRIEPKHIAKADLVVANSNYLATIAMRYNENAHFVGQGCNLSEFDAKHNYPLPIEYEKLPRPIIGFMGALRDSRLDMGIIADIATKRPNWSIVLLGPEDDAFLKSRLHDMKNIHFLGNIDSGLMPQYVSHFDVAIHPQKNNELTIGNYPRKIDEYLAMGKPIVATRTEAMMFFKEFVHLANKPEDFVHLIEQALTQNSPKHKQARIAFAHEHTWHKSASLISQYIEETEKKLSKRLKAREIQRKRL